MSVSDYKFKAKIVGISILNICVLNLKLGYYKSNVEEDEGWKFTANICTVGV